LIVKKKPFLNFEVMKKNKLNLLLSALAIILTAFSIWNLIQRPIEVRTMEVNFSVGATMGVNIDTDKLYFGRVAPGGSSERAVNIENTHDFPVKIKIFATDNIADYIFLDKEFIASPNNITQVPITLKVPESTPYGDYTGELRFEFRKTSS
jgi:hypothetical protein